MTALGRMWTLSLAILCSSAASTISQTPTVERIEVLPAGPHHIGDPLTIRLLVTAPASVAPEVDLPSDASDISWGTPTVEAVGTTSPPSPQTWEIRWPAQVFVVGSAWIPSLEVGVDGFVLNTEPFALTIESVRSGPDAQVLRDIRPPVETTRQRRWQIAALGAAFAFLLAAAALCVHRQRARRAAPRPTQSPVRVPEDWLNEQFGQLSHLSIGDATELRNFMARVADVVREYLAMKADLPAPHRTTRDTLRAAQRLLDDSTVTQLDQLLRGADLAKFARHVPPSAAAQTTLRDARSLCHAVAVQLTARAIAPSEAHHRSAGRSV